MSPMLGLVQLNDVEKLHPCITRVLGQNSSLMTLQGTNCYLIHPPSESSSSVLIDTGSPSPLSGLFVPKLLQTLQSFGVGSAITDSILTHHHVDHVGGLPDVLGALQDHQAGRRPRIHKLPIPRNSELALEDDEMVESLPENGVTLTKSLEKLHWLKDGDNLDLAGSTSSSEVTSKDGLQLEVIHTPGHSPDSICLLLRSFPPPAGKPSPTTSSPSLPLPILFSGDTILGQSTTVFTDLAAYLTSLRRLQALGVSTILPGHGPPIIGAEACKSKIEEYITHRFQREAQIISILSTAGSDSKRESLTVRQIVQMLYTGPNEGERVWRAAEWPVGAHLEKLESEGRVERRKAGDGAGRHDGSELQGGSENIDLAAERWVLL